MKKIITICLLITLLYSFTAQNDFESTTIGNQVWMTENLTVDKFRNGDKIIQAKTEEQWIDAADNDKPAFMKIKGKQDNKSISYNVYNWSAVTDKRGLAPKGWRIPTVKDYELLIQTLGGENKAGNKLKSKSGWNVNVGTNSSGFNAYPNTYVMSGVVVDESSFMGENHEGQWWASDRYGMFWLKGENMAPYPTVGIYEADVEDGLTIRCIKD